MSGNDRSQRFCLTGQGLDPIIGHKFQQKGTWGGKTGQIIAPFLNALAERKALFPLPLENVNVLGIGGECFGLCQILTWLQPLKGLPVHAKMRGMQSLHERERIGKLFGQGVAVVLHT